MKKYAFLAIAGFSGAVCAQSNVSISGRADVGIEVGNSGYGSKTRVQSGQSTGNRLTFKGDEKLGNDLSAFFILEAGYLLDNGQASSNGSLQQGGTPTAAGAGVNSGTNVASTGAGSYLFQRVSVLGLKSSFGTVQIGRMDSPAYPIMCSSDASACGTAARTSTVFGMLAGSADRFDSSVSYQTPNMNGFDAQIAYSTGAENNQTVTAYTSFDSTLAGNAKLVGTGKGEKDGKAWGLNLRYANGPMSLGWAYHNARLALGSADITAIRTNAETVFTGNGQAAANGFVNGVRENTAKMWILGGTYDFGMAKLFATYGAGKLETTGWSANATDGARLSDRRGWTLGASMPFGAHSVRLNLGKNDDRLTADQDYSYWGVHYEYVMSKRTAVYGAYAMINNANRAGNLGAARPIQSASSTSMSVNNVAGANGNFDPSALQIGVRHSF